MQAMWPESSDGRGWARGTCWPSPLPRRADPSAPRTHPEVSGHSSEMQANYTKITEAAWNPSQPTRDTFEEHRSRPPREVAAYQGARPLLPGPAGAHRGPTSVGAADRTGFIDGEVS